MWRVKNSKTSYSLARCKKPEIIYKKLEKQKRKKKKQHKKFWIQKEEENLL
jgi:hypothetical protein